MCRIFFVVFLVCFAFPDDGWAEVARTIEAKKIDIHPDLRIRDKAVERNYFGIIRDRRQFNRFWANMHDVVHGFELFGNPHLKRPEVDFLRYDVLWYAHRGSGASFVRSLQVLEYPGKVTARVTVFHSDFGSSSLNLWTIPKTDKPVVFEEGHEYETGGP